VGYDANEQEVIKNVNKLVLCVFLEKSGRLLSFVCSELTTLILSSIQNSSLIKWLRYDAVEELATYEGDDQIHVCMSELWGSFQ
jgi:hypothetical protein